MKRFLLSICVLLTAALAAHATEVTITASDVTWTTAETHDTYGEGIKYTDGTVTIEIYANGGQYTPKYNTDGYLQVYAQNMVLITAKDNNVVGVKFDFASTNYSKKFTCTEGSGSLSGTQWSWTGNVGTFSAYNEEAAQARIKTFTITYASPSSIVEAPVFSVAPGTYFDAQQVELTCATDGAQIYYTTDESEPTAESTLYEGTFPLSASTVVKAIAIKGSNKSVVATASYTFGHKVTTIAAALALADGEVVRFDGKVVAVYQYSSNLYVTDEAGDYALIYGSLGKTYSNGDVVPVGFYGTKKLFNGLTEFEAEASSFAASTEAESAVSPKTVKVSDVTTAIQNHYVRIEGVTLDPTDKTITDATGSLAFYNSFKVTLPSASATGSVEGIVSIYNNLQLLPIVFSEGTSVDMADADAVRIEAGRGVIEVRGSAASIEVYDIRGALIGRSRTTQAGAGIYFVRVGGRTSKVVVR